MGAVTFSTTVDKTVDISKTVNLTVNKTVAATVDVDGNLATAEASADAVGGGGNGEPDRFLIDEFSDPQFILVIGTLPPNGVADTVSGDDFQGTDIPSVASRTVTVESAAGSTSITFAQFDDPFEIGAGDVLEFDAGFNSTSDLTVEWTSSVGGFDLLGGADPGNAVLELNDVSTDLPVNVEFEFTDTDNDVASVIRTVPGGFVGEDFDVPLTDFLADAPVTPGDNPNSDLDFDSIVEIELRILGAQASDTVIDDVLVLVQPERPSGGALAETDTFAQVTADGAFSFSESLAAFDPDDFIVT